MKFKPPRTVYHGTDAAFEQFDNSNCLGAHFGSRAAAADRLKDTGRDRVNLFVHTDEDTGKIWACEQSLHNRPVRQHGPFASEHLARQFCDSHDGQRLPDAYEIDVYRPLVLADLGTWDFKQEVLEAQASLLQLGLGLGWFRCLYLFLLLLYWRLFLCR